MADYDAPETIANGTVEGPGGRPKAIAKECACGCGETVSARSTFRQGHDQRLIGRLAIYTADATLDTITRYRLALADGINDAVFSVRVDAVHQALCKLSSPQLAEKFYSAVTRRRDVAGRAKTAAVEAAKGGVLISSEQAVAAANEQLDSDEEIRRAHKANDYYEPAPGEEELDEANAALPDPVALGAPIRVKVGPRWEYDATVHGMNQSGKVTAVRYVPRSGKVRSKIATEGQFTIV